MEQPWKMRINQLVRSRYDPWGNQNNTKQKTSCLLYEGFYYKGPVEYWKKCKAIASVLQHIPRNLHIILLLSHPIAAWYRDMANAKTPNILSEAHSTIYLYDLSYTGVMVCRCDSKSANLSVGSAYEWKLLFLHSAFGNESNTELYTAVWADKLLTLSYHTGQAGKSINV